MYSLQGITFLGQWSTLWFDSAALALPSHSHLMSHLSWSSLHQSPCWFKDWLQLPFGGGNLKSDWPLADLSWSSQCCHSLGEFLWSPFQGRKPISTISALYSTLLRSPWTGAALTIFKLLSSSPSSANTEEADLCEADRALFCASTFIFTEIAWNHHTKWLVQHQSLPILWCCLHLSVWFFNDPWHCFNFPLELASILSSKQAMALMSLWVWSSKWVWSWGTV